MTVRPSLPDYHSINDVVSRAEFNSAALAEARYEQELLGGTNPTDKIAPMAFAALPVAARNILTNGGMEYWFRGNGPMDSGPTGSPPVSVDLATADAWKIKAGSGQAQRETTTVDGSLAAIKWTATAGGVIAQIVYNAQEFRAQTLTLTARVNGPASSYAYINDGVGFAASFLSTGAGGYETLAVSRTIDSSCTQIEVGIAATAAGTFYLDNVMLALSPGPVAYHPLDPSEDVKRCMARFQLLPFTYSFIAKGGLTISQCEVNLPQALTQTPPPGFTSFFTNGTRTNVASATISTVTTDIAVVDVAPAAAGYCAIVDAIILLDADLY
jgi:hypothetical protein